MTVPLLGVCSSSSMGDDVLLHVIHAFMENEQLFLLMLNFTVMIRCHRGSLAASLHGFFPVHSAGRYFCSDST